MSWTQSTSDSQKKKYQKIKYDSSRTFYIYLVYSVVVYLMLLQQRSQISTFGLTTLSDPMVNIFSTISTYSHQPLKNTKLQKQGFIVQKNNTIVQNVVRPSMCLCYSNAFNIAAAKISTFGLTIRSNPMVNIFSAIFTYSHQLLINTKLQKQKFIVTLLQRS